MAETVSREIRLKNRPVGLPRESDFELATVPLPPLAPARCWCATTCLLTLICADVCSTSPAMTSHFRWVSLSMVAAWGGWYSQDEKFQAGDYVLGRRDGVNTTYRMAPS
jgi:NADPH-dependent curcumin reductase CurA